MLDKRELLEAIEECESNLKSFADCQKLASLYVIYNQKFGKRNTPEPIYEAIVQENGNSEFLKAIRGKSATEMWVLMDEVMTDLQTENPRMYEHVMSQL